MTHTLINDIRQEYDRQTAYDASHFFDAMELPIPHALEYGRTHDNGYLLFLEQYGAVIRLTKQALAEPLSADPILKQLGDRDAHALKIEVFPGIITPVVITNKEFAKIDRYLDWRGLCAIDNYPRNWGIIPGSEEMGRRQLVSLDRLAIEKGEGLKAKILRAFAVAANRWSDPTPQDIIYAPLREKFSQAWPAGSKKSESGLVKEFWSTCVSMKKEGKLVTDWTKPAAMSQCSIVNNLRGSGRYADRLALTLAA